MIRHLLSSALFLLTVSVFGQDMSEIEDFGKNPGKLRLFVHVPDSLPKRDVPLVLVLHGCNQDAHGMNRISGWNKLADENGFIIAYPEQKGKNNANRCFNWFYGKDTEKGKGEVASIHQIVNYMKATYPINEQEISITGVSAGAVMSVTAAALYPEDYSAVASYAGGPYGSGNIISGVGSMFGWVDRKPWEWSRRVRLVNEDFKEAYPKMVILQGTADPVVNPKNANEIMEQWTGLHEVDRDSVLIQMSFQDNDLVKRSSWSEGEKQELVVLYEFKDLGHVLAVDVGTGKKQGGKKALFSKDIDFHSTYWIAKEFGLIKD